MYTSIVNTFFKRNSVMVGTFIAGAFVFQPTFDVAVTKWYENHNKGKLWKDIKGSIGGEDEDDE